MDDVIALLGGPPSPRPTVAVDDGRFATGYRGLRRAVFCERLGLFARDDTDERDGHPDTVVLTCSAGGRLLGGVRLHPVLGPGLGWWQGGRLVVAPDAPPGVGSLLVRAAVREAEALGALRFEATVLEPNVGFFTRLGWTQVRPTTVAGVPHRLMRAPQQRLADLARRTKADLGPLLAGLRPGGDGFVGDDAAPVPGGDTVASVDAILPAMVADDPFWAGWCGILVGAGDVAAMGAAPLGALDAVGSPDARHARRVVDGLAAAAEAFALPLLGGHTQLGVAPALSVTALGRTAAPVPGGGGRVGDRVTLSVDLAGDWRAGYGHRQWDSTSGRSRAELAAMLSTVGRTGPHAAKDVSMAGVVGTLGMLAEASGCGAELDVAAVPTPAGVVTGDWLTCFPGFGMLCTDDPARPVPDAGPAVTAAVGALTSRAGVRLRWPDGELTPALTGPVTGLGPAGALPHDRSDPR